MPDIVALNKWLHILDRMWYIMLSSWNYSFLSVTQEFWFYMPSGTNVIKMSALANSTSSLESFHMYPIIKGTTNVFRSLAELSLSWEEYKHAKWWRAPRAVIKNWFAHCLAMLPEPRYYATLNLMYKTLVNPNTQSLVLYFSPSTLNYWVILSSFMDLSIIDKRWHHRAQSPTWTPC